ncbi:Crp/Fnr family transcriptional regulator [uncultured Algibacter sp.]|uniref:Crp/Fnr family transcriptional regulator n=1 Tax=uncultured Algibacter sp. TaxID=298659 RepID=UPI0026349D60|nr:Crp/Fnr family transcriptional regulator [uncultured Algibacter sp.]
MEQDKNANRCENCIVRQFNDLHALNRDELSEVSKAKVSKIIKKGDILFEEGEKLNGVFCIRDGVSKLSKLSSNGKDQIVKLATKGEVIGQSSVIADEKVNLSATALNDMQVCFIPKEKIVNPLKANPKFTLEVLKTVVSDLKDSNDTIINLSQKNVKQRIAQTLIYLKNNYGEDNEGYLSMSLSREDLSSVVGTATESCIRSVSAMKKEGYILISNKKTKILDVKKLERLIYDL